MNIPRFDHTDVGMAPTTQGKHGNGIHTDGEQ